DARMNPDAPVTPDAPLPDAMPTGGLRPWAGDTTHVRVLDLQLLTPDKGTRVCIFGTDADARPYAVLSGTSHDLADSYQLAAAYDVSVPAGIPLKIYVHDWSGGVPDTSTTGCATGASQNIGSLTSDHYYSLARNVNFVDD